MAKPKSKKVIDDEVDAIEEAVEETDVETADVDAEVEADVEVDADDEPTQKRQSKADDDDDEGGDEPSLDDAPKAPTPKLTLTTKILMLLNGLAGGFFVFMFLLANDQHTHYTYRTIVNYTRIWGLPLKSEETPASLAVETRPVLRLNAQQLAEAFRKRATGVSVSEPFVAIEEPLPLYLRPSDMSDMLVKDIFAGLSDPVKTLDAEIERLQQALPSAIEAAASKVAADTKKENRRGAIKKMLLPIAWDVWQVKRLNDKLAATKDDDLEAMLVDTVQRRIYYDILAPINLFRPGAEDDYKIDKIAAVDSYVLKTSDGDVELKGYTIEQLKGFLQQRLKAAVADKFDTEVHHGKRWATDDKSMTRDNNERRQAIAFILFTVGQTQVPTLNEPLVNKGLDRAQIVSGMNEFSNASDYFVVSQRILQQRIAEAIHADREGWLLTLKDKGETSRTNGFIDEYQAEVQRLIRIVESIETAQKRIADLKGQRDEFTKLHDVRADQQKKTMEKLVNARQESERQAKKLRELQQQLHEALIELADAATRNFTLEAQIRAIELNEMSKTKGAKKLP